MMLLARRYGKLEFEELEPFPCDGLIIYAVRIVIFYYPRSLLYSRIFMALQKSRQFNCTVLPAELTQPRTSATEIL